MRAQGIVTWVCAQQARRRTVGEHLMLGLLHRGNSFACPHPRPAHAIATRQPSSHMVAGVLPAAVLSLPFCSADCECRPDEPDELPANEATYALPFHLQH